MHRWVVVGKGQRETMGRTLTRHIGNLNIGKEKLSRGRTFRGEVATLAPSLIQAPVAGSAKNCSVTQYAGSRCSSWESPSSASHMAGSSASASSASSANSSSKGSTSSQFSLHMQPLATDSGLPAAASSTSASGGCWQAVRSGSMGSASRQRLDVGAAAGSGTGHS